ncbi:MAG: hypothetical protein QXF12_04425 [Candidatus Aenigmatarchaeota archaeon]
MKIKKILSNDNDFGATDVVFRDMISLLLLGFVLMFFILIIFVNPNKNNKEESPIKTPGSLSVLLTWDPGVDVDLDLWGKSPEDHPIGYPNRENKTCNLVRDDLGLTNDFFPENFENIFCRNLIPGEYIFNVHFYSLKQEIERVNYRVEIRIFVLQNGRPFINRLLMEKKDFFYGNERGVERTLIRFKVKENGDIDENSINNEFVSIIRLHR